MIQDSEQGQEVKKLLGVELPLIQHELIRACIILGKSTRKPFILHPSMPREWGGSWVACGLPLVHTVTLFHRDSGQEFL